MTVVTRESPWDDDTRDRVLRHSEHKRLTCGCGCGQQLTVSTDTEQPWFVDFFVCQAGKAKAQREAADQDDAKAQGKPDGWDAGRHYFVKPYDPDTDVLKPKGAVRGDKPESPKPRSKRL